jgi:hypothetical protein
MAKVSITIDNKKALLTGTLATCGALGGIVIARTRHSGYLFGTVWVLALAGAGILAGKLIYK